MRNVRRVFFSTLASLSLAAAVWSMSLTAARGAALSLSNDQNAPQELSVSGRIASLEKSSFTLTVGQSQTSTEGQKLQQEPSSPKTMTFLLDKNTTIEGSLRVGANAEVTYRQEKGVNVAISVHITP